MNPDDFNDEAIANDLPATWGDVDVPTRGMLPTVLQIFGEGKLASLEVLTQTAIGTLQACPRKFDLRYQHGLAAPRVEGPLWFGRQFHDAKELMLRHVADGMDPRDAAEQSVLMLETRLLPGAANDPVIADELVKLRVAIRRYAWRWFRSVPMFPGDEVHIESEWIIESVEERTIVPIVNPETGASSKTFALGLRTDERRRNRATGQRWIGETKTASRIDSTYIERLWVDRQLLLYGQAVERAGGESIVGAVYDVIAKCGLKRAQYYLEPGEEYERRIEADRAERLPRLIAKYSEARIAREEKLRVARESKREKLVAKGKKKPKKGEPEETDAQFADRILAELGTDADFEAQLEQELGTAESIEARARAECDAAIGPVESGGLKTLQRIERLEETIESFESRVDEWYARQDAFVRLLVPFDSGAFSRVAYDQWDATKSILEARQRGHFARHTGSCYAFNRPCAFVGVCKSGDGELTPQSVSLLARVPPHEELRDASADPLPEVDGAVPASTSMI